jgi:hypothetical protein
MDIEGGETLWVNSLSGDDLKNVRQMVIEIHGIANDDWGSSSQDKIDALNIILKNHVLVHVHGNNCSDLSLYEGFVVPSVLELTFVRRLDMKDFRLNTEPLPTNGLDFSNKQGFDVKDYDLNYPPFVFPKYSYMRDVKEKIMYVVRMRKKIRAFFERQGLYATIKLGIRFLRYGRNGVFMKTSDALYRDWMKHVEKKISYDAMQGSAHMVMFSNSFNNYSCVQCRS